jgi:hypothetical protein
VSFTNNQVNFPVANASASINNTGALINVNAIRYPTSIIIMGRLELDEKIKISTETAYRFVLQDKAVGGALYKYLRHQHEKSSFAFCAVLLAMGSARYSLLLRSARVAKPPLCPLPITKSTSQSPMQVRASTILKQANRLADERHQKKNKAIKLTDSVKNYISEKLKEYWSPEQIMGRLELDKKISRQIPKSKNRTIQTPNPQSKPKKCPPIQTLPSEKHRHLL